MKTFGNVYKIFLANGKYSLMQHLGDDSNQLNSAVVFVLTHQFTANDEVQFDKIVKNADGFFAHVFLNAGKALKIWEKTSLLPIAFSQENVVWSMCEIEDTQLESTSRWYCWKTGGKNRPPLSAEELDSSELGIVMNPYSIVFRIENGKYDRKSPRKVFLRD